MTSRSTNVRSMPAARRRNSPLQLWNLSGKTLPASWKSRSKRLDRKAQMSTNNPLNQMKSIAERMGFNLNR
jgi:hypothetical protein